MAPSGLVLTVLCSCYGPTRAGCSTLVGSHKGRTGGQNRGQNPLPSCCPHSSGCSSGHGCFSGLWAHFASSYFLSTMTPKPFSQGCSQSVLCPACRCAWDCSDPDVGPCISLCSTSSLRIIYWACRAAPVKTDAMAIAHFLGITWLRLVLQPPGESLCCRTPSCVI